MSYEIYVACVAAYNAGRLHGVWIDAHQPAEDLHRQIQDMLKASPVPGAEEFRIDDIDGFGDIKADRVGIDELETLCDLLEEYDPEVVAAAMEHNHGKVTVIEDFLRNSCSMIFESDEKYGDYLLETSDAYSQIPSHLHCYIDAESYGRDSRINSSYTCLTGDRFIVWN